jgi:hypothetical protein
MDHQECKIRLIQLWKTLFFYFVAVVTVIIIIILESNCKDKELWNEFARSLQRLENEQDYFGMSFKSLSLIG